MTELNLALRALHLLGAIAWIGGTVAVALVAARAASDGKGAVVAPHARAIAVRWGSTGMVLAFAGGLTLLALGWAGYARAGWMHGKILLVLIAAGLSGVLSGKLRTLAAGEEVSPSTLSRFAFALIALAVLVLVLVLLGPILMPARTG
ncbi:MAG: hypothetical protein AAGE52_26720 [Myxococcota bacterium]